MSFPWEGLEPLTSQLITDCISVVLHKSVLIVTFCKGFIARHMSNTDLDVVDSVGSIWVLVVPGICGIAHLQFVYD